MLSELERCRVEGLELVGQLTEREFLVLGLALYAGEGSKSPGEVRFANTDPRMIVVFITWLRHFFEIDESRLRVRLYLHEISTKLRPSPTGRTWSASRRVSSTSRTGPRPTPRSAATGTSTAVRR